MMKFGARFALVLLIILAFIFPSVSMAQEPPDTPDVVSADSPSVVVAADSPITESPLPDSPVVVAADSQADYPIVVIQSPNSEPNPVNDVAYEWGFVAVIFALVIAALIWQANKQSEIIKGLSQDLKEMVPPEAFGPMQKFALDGLQAGSVWAEKKAAQTQNKIDDALVAELIKQMQAGGIIPSGG